jgi:hypothetical protein
VCYDVHMGRANPGLWVMALLLTFAGTAMAQQEPKPKELPDAPVAKQDTAPEKHENAINETVGILGRRSLFFPDLATTPKPLSSKQKFELFVDQSVAPSRFLSSAFTAGIGQARDSLRGYGEGGTGYGKRFGSSMASAAASNFFGTFLLASALHRDPRFFVSMHSGVGYRIGYAITRIVIGRTNDGRKAANWPGMLGPLLAESLANSYLPEQERTAGNTFQRYGWRIGANTAGNVLREYWPVIFRSLHLTKITSGLTDNPAPPAPAAAHPSP